MDPLHRFASSVQFRLETGPGGKPVRERAFAGDYDHTATVAPLIIASLMAIIELLKWCYGNDADAIHRAAKSPGPIQRWLARRAVRKAMKASPDPAFDGVDAGQIVDEATAVAGNMPHDDFVALIKSLEK